MRLATCILAAAAAVLATRSVAAQGNPRADSLTRPLSSGMSSTTGYAYNRQSHLMQRDAESLMRARIIEQDLAALRLAQDIYYANHLAYATSLEQLPKFRAASGAVITLRDVTATGWTAEATHPSLPGSTFIGQVTRAESVERPESPQ